MSNGRSVKLTLSCCIAYAIYTHPFPSFHCPPSRSACSTTAVSPYLARIFRLPRPNSRRRCCAHDRHSRLRRARKSSTAVVSAVGGGRGWTGWRGVQRGKGAEREREAGTPDGVGMGSRDGSHRRSTDGMSCGGRVGWSSESGGRGRRRGRKRRKRVRFETFASSFPVRPFRRRTAT